MLQKRGLANITLLAAFTAIIVLVVAFWLFQKRQCQFDSPGEPFLYTKCKLSRISRSPQEASPFELCDFDKDGKCDEVDLDIFQTSFGACRGDENYHPIADINGDGCVATADQKSLFPEMDTFWYLTPTPRN